MSLHTVHIRTAVSFKGETQQLKTRVDLDACTGNAEEPPNFHLILARATGIDPISYLYEVLESETLEFFDPSPAVAPFCQGEAFDWAGFAAAREARGGLAEVREIARTLLNEPDLDARPALRHALLAAYQAGRGAVAATSGD